MVSEAAGRYWPLFQGAAGAALTGWWLLQVWVFSALVGQGRGAFENRQAVLGSSGDGLRWVLSAALAIFVAGIVARRPWRGWRRPDGAIHGFTMADIAASAGVLLLAAVHLRRGALFVDVPTSETWLRAFSETAYSIPWRPILYVLGLAACGYLVLRGAFRISRALAIPYRTLVRGTVAAVAVGATAIGWWTIEALASGRLSAEGSRPGDRCGLPDSTGSARPPR